MKIVLVKKNIFDYGSRKKPSFTLAEVLITLGIVGIVASTTIPTLLNTTNDAELNTAWKKSYSDLIQANSRVLLENGGTLKSACIDGDNNCLRDLFKPYLNYTKECDANDVTGKCWCTNLKYLDNTDHNTYGSVNAGLALNNGSFILFHWQKSNCDYTAFVISRCGDIDVDVNGFKGPNTLGKDIFGVNLLESSVVPWGDPRDSFGACSPSNPVMPGTGCSFSRLYQ